jgi:hypothetical protein
VVPAPANTCSCLLSCADLNAPVAIPASASFVWQSYQQEHGPNQDSYSAKNVRLVKMKNASDTTPDEEASAVRPQNSRLLSNT